MDRKKIKTKSALSPIPVPHGAVKFHKVSNEEAKLKDREGQGQPYRNDGLSTLSSQIEFNEKGKVTDPTT